MLQTNFKQKKRKTTSSASSFLRSAPPPAVMARVLVLQSFRTMEQRRPFKILILKIEVAKAVSYQMLWYFAALCCLVICVYFVCECMYPNFVYRAQCPCIITFHYFCYYTHKYSKLRNENGKMSQKLQEMGWNICTCVFLSMEGSSTPNWCSNGIGRTVPKAPTIQWETYAECNLRTYPTSCHSCRNSIKSGIRGIFSSCQNWLAVLRSQCR